MNAKKALFLLATGGIFCNPLVNAKNLRVLRSNDCNEVDALDFTQKITNLSDKAPMSPALDNEFWDAWLSDEKVEPQQIKDIFLNFRALTEATSKSVALAFIATSDARSGASFGQNLYEETGEGNSEKAHIKQLDKFILAMGKAANFQITQEELDNCYLNVLPKTLEALDEQGQLYTATNIDGEGLNFNFLNPFKSPEVIASIKAVSAAHESKAPGMLTKLLEGSVKYLGDEDKKNPDIYKYFEEHLGEDVVSKVLKGDKISPSLLQENESTRGFTSDELRSQGMVEQAHRKDAVNSVIKTIESIDDKCEASIATKTAIESFEMFLESHGEFWKSLHDSIICKDKNCFVKAYRNEENNKTSNRFIL